MDGMTKLERGPMVGRMLEGDFEKDTITFHMPATYYLANGRYIIEPESDWLRRKEQLEALSARASAGEGGEAFDTGPFIESLVDDGMIDLAIEAYNANYEGGQRAWMKAALISALKGINND